MRLSRWFGHALGGQQHGVDDLLIAGAAAKVAFEGLARLGPRGMGVFGQQGIGGENHARRAKAALDGAVGDEGFLERVQRFEVFALVLLMLGAQGARQKRMMTMKCWDNKG